MVSRGCLKLGIFLALFVSVFLSLLLPGHDDAGGDSATKVLRNLQDTWSYLILKVSWVAEALFGTIFDDHFFGEIASYIPEYLDWVVRESQQCTTKIHLVVVACGDRLEESLVNIKSSLLFTKAKIVFHIFADDELQSGFKDEIESWPLSYRRNLEYHIYPITFPADGNEANWRKLFKPCASQRLFLPLILDDSIDSVLYVDTDILFISDVKEFWEHFNRFNSTQLSSLCIEHEDKRMAWYSRFARHPYYGTTGVNSGVMLMNLTRMRRARYKNDLVKGQMEWGEMLLPLYKKYKLNITWGDQDLLNIVFHHNPEMLQIFQCDWNYRPDHCMYGQMCKPAADGVKIVHGSRQVYHNEKQPTFKAVYDAIKGYGFQRNLTKHLFEVNQVEILQKYVHGIICHKISVAYGSKTACYYEHILWKRNGMHLEGSAASYKKEAAEISSVVPIKKHMLCKEYSRRHSVQ